MIPGRTRGSTGICAAPKIAMAAAARLAGDNRINFVVLDDDGNSSGV